VTIERNPHEEVDRLLGTVDEVMERTVLVLAPGATLDEAAHEMERRGVSGAPVVEGGRVVGIVSLSDLFEIAGISAAQARTASPWRRYERRLSESGKTVRSAMTSAVYTLGPGASVAHAAELMWEHGVNRVPIVGTDGQVEGIVAREDVVAAVARAGLGLRVRPPVLQP